MSRSVAASRLRPLLVLHALWALPMAALAQQQTASSDPLASRDSVIIVESVRIRTAPSPASLSIEELPRGTTLAIEAGTAVGGPWIAVRFDERTAFVPREYVTVKLAPRAPATASTPPASPPPTPAAAPTRVAMAVVDTPKPAPAAQPLAAPQTPAPTRATATPPSATPVPARENPAPVIQAGTPSRAESPRAAEAPPRVSSAAASSSPAATREPAPADHAAAAPPPAPKDAANDPNRMRRPSLPALVSVALLGSVTPYTVTTTGAKVLHVSGHSLFTVSAFGWGLYAAPEYGSGAGHRSTMLGGGLLRQLLRSGPVHVTVLGGVTLYTEVPDGDYAASFVSRSIRASSVGGLITLPFVGPARIAYRGQYLRGLGADADFHKIRHAVGLAF